MEFPKNLKKPESKQEDDMELGKKRWSHHNEFLMSLDPESMDRGTTNFFKRGLGADKIISNALSLGTGGNNADLIDIADKGYERITCVDIDNSIEKMVQKLDHECDSEISFLHQGIDNFSTELKYSFVSSNFALSFINKESMSILIEKIHGALEDRGIFAFNVFGEQEPWKEKDSGQVDGILSKYSVREITEMVNEKFDIEDVEDIEYDKTTSSGNMKHWHSVGLVLRKKVKENK